MAGIIPPSRILVVDDDEGLLILMAGALRDEGYEVATAESGTAAMIALSHQTPDLILLDLKMKDVAGPTLLKRLRREDMSIPFVVVTGQGDEKVAVEMMKFGALDYVMKATGLLDLLPGVVKRALEKIERDRALATALANLKESEARFATALEATNDGVWEVQVSEGKVYFSARWRAILGYEPSEISDHLSEWQRRVHPEDLDRFSKAYHDFLEGSANTFGIEHRVRHKDGTYRWILSRALLIRDDSGKPLRVTGAHTDITERKQLEKEILRISDREQWRIGQELHDGLGQQLTAIELMCQSLKGDLEATLPESAVQVARMGKFLREAIAQTRSLAHGLTPFMLDAGGLQAALAELAERTSSLGRLKCRFICPNPVPLKDSEAAGHFFRIAQEAANNALKHAGANEIVLSLTGGNGVVQLKVSDNGKGMHKIQKSKDGIGLQVLRHRANTIGAELTVESKPGKGVTITCTMQRKI